MYDAMFYVTYLLIVLAALGFFAGTIRSLLNDKKSGMVAGIAVVVLLVVFFIGSAMNSAVPDDFKQQITESAIGKVNGGIVLFYVLLFGALAMMAVDLVKGLISGK